MSGTAAAHVLEAVRSRAPTLRGHGRVVGVDGPAGSGKTTLAGQVAGSAAADGSRVTVVHLDDLYQGWRGVLTVAPEVHRLLRSLHETGTATYRRFDWHLDDWAEEHHVVLPDLLVVEGVGSCPAVAEPLLTLQVWVEAPRDLRLRRGIERDGEHLRAQWLQFLDDEEQVHRADRTRERADVVVDGTTGSVRSPATAARDPRGRR